MSPVPESDKENLDVNSMNAVEEEEVEQYDDQQFLQEEKAKYQHIPANEKMEKLDLLLEKAGAYSKFLFSNMPQPPPSDVPIDVTTTEEVTPPPKRKRGRPKKNDPSTPKNTGKRKLEQIQQQQGGIDSVSSVDHSFKQPSLVTGGTLRPYQLEGVRWLCNLFENGLNGILADEMGLGKTIQVISLIAQLRSLGVSGPFLIVGPLSTLSNWVSEFAKWAPSIDTVLYHGRVEDRRLLRRQKMPVRNQHSLDQFPIVITSYEIIMRDRAMLQNIGFKWKYIIIDEGHRLKNMKCRLVRELKKFHSENRLLLTGTPLQNNLIELWALLNYILPDVFDDLEMFESWFINHEEESNLNEDDQIVTKLHEILRPFLLRRLKKQVVKDLPSKTEIVVYAPMAPLQKTYYSMIIDGSLASALQAKYGAIYNPSWRTTTLRNKAMQLRKCCNHPYLFDQPHDDRGHAIINQEIITSSGKMQILCQMLKILREKGHKILIFSQMTQVLDLIQDMCQHLLHYSICRLDGGTRHEDRVRQMQEFNDENGDKFVFLLSTRAGGLGINLIGADTVILFDSDWNPQQDNQAQDRCHRIGQTKPVVIYRLITENSFENRMLARANAKRKLDRIVIQRGHFNKRQQSSSYSHGRPRELTDVELKELLQDDVVIRDGIESGGVSESDLALLCDREKVQEFFVNVNKNISSSKKGKTRKLNNKGMLPHKGQGYEVIDTSQFATMEEFV